MIYMKNTKMLAVMLCGSLLLSGCNTHNISETPDTKNSYTTPMPVFSTTDESSKSTTVIETTLPLSADTSADTTTTTSPPQSEAPVEETSVSSETTDFVTVHWPLDEDEDTILNNNIYTSATESTSANEVFCPPATYVTTTARTTAATTTTIQTKKPEGTTTKPPTTNSTNIDIPDESLEFIDDYTRKYYYNTLTDTQRAYYRYCFNKKRYSINDPEPNYSSKDKDIAYFAFQRENPHLQLYPTQYQIDNELTSMTPQKRKKILKIANAIADKANQYDRTFDKIKVIHDELLEHITFDYYNEMISAFLEGKADCSGYADAFCMVCQLAGIDCIVVWGTAHNSAMAADHAWNMVKLDDDWYNVDVSWDDVKLFTHTYFLRSDKAFSSNHTVDMPITCPKATKKYPVDQYGNETK